MARLWRRWRAVGRVGLLALLVLLPLSVVLGGPGLWMVTLGTAAVWLGSFARWWRLDAERERWAARLHGTGATPRAREPELLPGQIDALPPPGPEQPEPVDVRLVLDEACVWPTTDGAGLRLGPGEVRVRFRLSAGVDPGRTQRRRERSEILVGRTLTVGSRHRGVLSRERSPAAARQPRALSASGRGGEVTMMLKHQGPRLDLAWLPEEAAIVVRASQMYYEVWEGERYRSGVDRVCFGYCLDPSIVLPLPSTEHHWTEWREWETADSPRTPVFEARGAEPSQGGNRR